MLSKLPRNAVPLIRYVGIGLILLVSNLPAVDAEDWMYRRSYYSHQVADGSAPAYPLPESRSAYRTAYYPNGFGISTAFRVNNYIIQNGARVDQTYYREGWIQFNSPQD